MVLSVTEKSYLRDSLKNKDHFLRPDGRNYDQFRPVEIYTDFLPSSNGSSRILASDGTEIVISIKTEVVDHSLTKDLVSIDLDITGYRDDSAYVTSIRSILSKTMKSKLNFTKEKGPKEKSVLQLTKKYSFKLYIDILVLSNYSYPLSLISFAIYSALETTKLPMLISSEDDLEIEELPIFHDYDMITLDFQSPLIFLVAFIEDNVFIDPSDAETQVANKCLILTWFENKISSPIRTVSLNDDYTDGFTLLHLKESIEVVRKCAPEVLRALKYQ
ncbi:related to Exosome complex component RRP42 [Saccharomycodes ludwigii]|uniref:Ribosomal RNA-processing protein 42 n=1 Tax=Saccharomycodes ludwigii TaxID=36035 RepID=A0A376B8C6_9ASCO|nr:hypothetical protein SCDLUD_002710 [Saccharomycodes ludwigii]KAH3901224.1 hypothetical protein SCDLUD_002710 [Saccharomycodes ludwigii]SSD60819.1 related to Exosome complex component RRP42 [Saccharomycodes ludwigii]